jgi:hypothetical protein
MVRDSAWCVRCGVDRGDFAENNHSAFRSTVYIFLRGVDHDALLYKCGAYLI